jgi:hypothetical protein
MSSTTPNPAPTTPTPDSTTPTPDSTTPTTPTAIPQSYAPKTPLPDDKYVSRSRKNVDYKAIDFFYDACIDIHSIASAKDGWSICGKNWKELNNLFARVIAVVGDFKDGKTRLISLIAGRPLPYNNTLHTPGIAITLPESVVLSTPKSVAPEGIAAAAAATTTASPKGKRPRRKVNKTHTNEPSLIEDCFIDTEGTDQPCSERNLIDVRATEFFLRTLIIEVASRVIFVTRKWGFQAQTKVVNLVQQMNDQPDPNQHITPTQRLIVVHNHPEASSMETLERSIKEVEESYLEASIPANPAYRSIRPWTKMETSDRKQHYYASVFTHHFFLMNHDSDVGKAYNESIISELRNQLKGGAPPVKRDFIEYIRQRAAHNLTPYIKGWDVEQCDLELTENEDGVPMLAPVLKPQPDGLPEGVERTKILDDDKYDYDFELHPCEFTGHSVISDGYSLLQGELHIFKPKHELQAHVKCSGITVAMRRSIKIRLHPNGDAVEVTIKSPKPTKKQDYEVFGSTYRYGYGVYKVSLPEPLRFVRPECDPLDLVTIENGVVILKLKLAHDIDYFNDHEDDDDDDDDDDEDEDEEDGDEQDKNKNRGAAKEDRLG